MASAGQLERPRRVAAKLAGSIPALLLGLSGCNNATSHVDRVFGRKAQLLGQPLQPVDSPIHHLHEQAWTWKCETGRFNDCDASQDFVVDPQTDICTYSMVDHLEVGANPNEPPTVREIPGGIHLHRKVFGQGFDIHRGHGRFDTTVTVAVIDRVIPSQNRVGYCYGNTSNIKREDAPKPPPLVTRSFCVNRGGAAPGWLVIGVQDVAECARSKHELSGRAQIAVHEPEVPAGTSLDICNFQGVPPGWDDLGTHTGGATCQPDLTGSTILLRTIRKR